MLRACSSVVVPKAVHFILAFATKTYNGRVLVPLSGCMASPQTLSVIVVLYLRADVPKSCNAWAQLYGCLQLSIQKLTDKPKWPIASYRKF